MIIGSINQEDIINVNIYTPNIRKLNYIKQIPTGLKGEIDNTIIVGSFNNSLSGKDRLSRQKINKETWDLSCTLDQTDLDIYRTFHPRAEYIFFSSTYRTFSKKNHMTGHKISLSKFNIEITPTVHFAHNVMKLEINKKTVKSTNMWKLKSTLLKNNGSKKKLKGK